MANVILNKELHLNPSLSDLDSITDFSFEDKIVLLASRHYMLATNTDVSAFCVELFELASQALSHSSDDFLMMLSRNSSKTNN